jgi:hypothetical protein
VLDAPVAQIFLDTPLNTLGEAIQHGIKPPALFAADKMPVIVIDDVSAKAVAEVLSPKDPHPLEGFHIPVIGRAVMLVRSHPIRDLVHSERVLRLGQGIYNRFAAFCQPHSMLKKFLSDSVHLYLPHSSSTYQYKTIATGLQGENPPIFNSIPLFRQISTGGMGGRVRHDLPQYFWGQ